MSYCPSARRSSLAARDSTPRRDVLSGGGGADLLLGGTGADILDEPGRDTLSCGAGRDVARTTPATACATANASSGRAEDSASARSARG
jgi:hypothetical protein